jgi:hypothetical protein
LSCHSTFTSSEHRYRAFEAVFMKSIFGTSRIFLRGYCTIYYESTPKERLVGTGRFELPTCRLGGDRSIHLSYVPEGLF